MNSRRKDILSAVKIEKTVISAALFVLLVLPFVVGPYWRSAATLFAINCIILLGYRIITTMGGWSFAHIAILGIGAYTTAILTTGDMQVYFWATVPLSIALSGLAALILTVPILRTQNYYFFLATFAAAEAIRQGFIRFTGLTNGNSGIAFIPRPEGFGIANFQNDIQFYFLILAVLIMVVLSVIRFDKSYTSRVIKTVADNPDISESIGINTWKYKSIAFILGSAIAGLAGAFLSSYNGAISPTDYGSTAMFKIVAAAVVGGTSTISGPIIGLIYLTFVEEAFRNSPDWVPLIWGASVIVALLKTKGGIEVYYKYFETKKSDEVDKNA